MVFGALTQPHLQTGIPIRRSLRCQKSAERGTRRLHDRARLAFGKTKSGDQLVRGSPLSSRVHYMPLAISFNAVFSTSVSASRVFNVALPASSFSSVWCHQRSCPRTRFVSDGNWTLRYLTRSTQRRDLHHWPATDPPGSTGAQSDQETSFDELS